MARKQLKWFSMQVKNLLGAWMVQFGCVKPWARSILHCWTTCQESCLPTEHKSMRERGPRSSNDSQCHHMLVVDTTECRLDVRGFSLLFGPALCLWESWVENGQTTPWQQLLLHHSHIHHANAWIRWCINCLTTSWRLGLQCSSALCCSVADKFSQDWTIEGPLIPPKIDKNERIPM